MLLVGKIRTRGSAEEADRPDEPDGARTDVRRTEVVQMEQTDEEGRHRWNWNRGLSNEIDAAHGKGLEPRFG
jgi:hypothetical protein